MAYGKTLGSLSARLVAQLYDLGKTIFTIRDVTHITGLNYFSAGRLISELTKRKIIATLKKGKHIIIPQELGSTDTFTGNWYVAAREVVNSSDYYVGFYSAMQYWGLTTQPLNKLFIAVSKRQIVPNTLRGRLYFVLVNRTNIWGVKKEWVTKTEQVRISDMEKTILDSLVYPQYCGGITEIAKAIWLGKGKIDFERLLSYVRKLNSNVAGKRLGFILEILNMDVKGSDLKEYVKDRYDLFDPTLPHIRKGRNHWRLIDNVGKDQILKIVAY